MEELQAPVLHPAGAEAMSALTDETKLSQAETTELLNAVEEVATGLVVKVASGDAVIGVEGLVEAQICAMAA